MELMSQEPIANLIDLGQYTRNDVELIAREFMRCAYLETLETFAKEYASLGEEDETRKNVLSTLEAFEHTIAVLDGSEEFLEAVHAEPDAAAENDSEFERF
jgi:hypothetical protein|tara:strand:- start:924 stop:1226 length:303 start_codon:yes stop_codon:yes gene_type:complete